MIIDVININESFVIIVFRDCSYLFCLYLYFY